MAASNSITTPVSHKIAEEMLKVSGLSSTQGVASKYWLELISIPAGSNNRLWLFVNNTWTHLANSTASQQAAVQNAFNSGSNLEVAVWFDNANNIVGLVVRSH